MRKRSIALALGVAWGFSHAALAQQPIETINNIPAQAPSAQDAAILPEVRVTGAGESATGPVFGYRATRSATATKTDTPIIETPQSLSVVTRDEMDARGAQSVVEAAAYTTGVGNPYPDPHGDWLYIRGFFSTQYLDGMRIPYAGGGGAGTLRTEPWGLERIEVLRGPASVLYGQNAPGGLANSVSKRPTATPQHEVQLQAGSFSRVQGAFDFSGPISEDGKFLYRLNGLVRDADAAVDYVRNDRRFIAPSLTWQPSADTSLTLLTHFLDEDLTPRNFLPATGTLLPNPNGKIPHNRYVGEPGFDKYARSQHAIGYAFEHRFNDMFTLRQNFRYAEVDVFSRSMSGGFSNVQPNLRTLNRTASQAWRDSESTSLDTHLQANFITGALKHAVLTGIDYTKYDESTRTQSAAGTPIDVFNPVYGAPFSGIWANGTPTLQEQERPGLYMQDQISFDRWRFTIGGRYERVDTSTRNQQTNAVTATLKDSEFTGRFGTVYLFDSGFAPYYSYSESFEPVSGTDFFGVPFKPTMGVLHEVGLRYQPPGTNALLSAAVYDQRQQNRTMTDTDPTHTCNGGGFGSCSVQTGELTTRGVELEGKFSLKNGLNLTASYAYTDAELTKSSINQGKAATQLAPHMASVWADYRLREGPLAGLNIGGGVRYTGYSWADGANTVKLPDYSLVDAMLRYDLGQVDPKWKGARLALNIRNLFDKEYFPGICSTTYCQYGEGRSANLTLSYQW
jgi:iron complex outermembrane receptor protein